MQGIILQHNAKQISGKQLQIHTANIHIFKVHQYALIEQSDKCAYILYGMMHYIIVIERSYWIISTVT